MLRFYRTQHILSPMKLFLPKESSLKNPQLPGHAINFDGNDIGVLLIHGFTATTAEVRLLSESFLAKGCTVKAPLLPGHGTNPQDLNRTKFSDWTTCVTEAFLDLQSKCSTTIIGGESLGAVLCMYIATIFDSVDALLLYSPALLVSSLKYAKYLRYFNPLNTKSEEEDYLPWQGYCVYPMFATHEFLLLTKIIRKNLHKINTPTALFLGKNDQTINKNNGAYIINRISSKTISLYVMEKSGHVMLVDKELKTIVQYTEKFLENNVHTFQQIAGL